MAKRPENEWRCWWPFALLCLLGASNWLLTDSWPDTASTLATEAIACGLAAFVWIAVSVMRKRSRPSVKSAGNLLLIGAGLLGAPSLGSVFTGTAHNPYNRTASFCLVPTVLGVLLNIRDDKTEVLPTPWPGLAGLAGVLLLTAVMPPHSVAAWVSLVAPPVAVAFACFAIRPVLRQSATEWAMAMMFAGGAASLGVLIWVVRMTRSGEVQSVTLEALGLDLLTSVLVVLTAVRLNPARYASRYLVLAALTVVEGLIVLRPHVSARTFEGLILLIVGSVALWRVRAGEQESTALHLS